MRGYIALVLLVCVGTLTGAESFEYRYSVHSGSDLRRLIDNPQVITFTMNRFWDDAHKEDRIINYADSHAVFDLPLDRVAEILGSSSEIRNISPRVAEVRIESGDESSTFVLYEEIVIDVLGFKSGYKFRIFCETQSFPDGSRGGRTRLVESVDSTMYELYSSWYAQRVVVDGRGYTYVRLFNRNGLRNPVWGTETFGPMFGPGELRDNLFKIRTVVKDRK